MTDDVLVHAESVSRSYHAGSGVATTAIKEASFSVAGGDRIALTGPSGSGKTTLLHLACGLDSPTSGSIEWPALGQRSQLRPSRIALAFQGPSLLPALDVAENVALPLLLGGASETEAAEAASRILERMGLGELAPKLPDTLSGGQSQRVGLARALAVRPVLLLADEPTGQQDRDHAGKLLELLLEMADEWDIALLVATHDPSVAGRLARRWSISNGVLETGSA